MIVKYKKQNAPYEKRKEQNNLSKCSLFNLKYWVVDVMNELMIGIIYLLFVSLLR